MSESVQAALTAGEWARFLSADKDRQVIQSDLNHELYAGHSCSRVALEEGEDSVPRNHAIAAIALHGQPFGFTREDVEMLRRSADAAAKDFYQTWGAEMYDLATRIAALLPPEPMEPTP